MDDTAATIECLAAERDALARALAHLTMAVQSPDLARLRIGREAVTRYLTEHGYTQASHQWWRHPTRPGASVSTHDVTVAARELAYVEERPEPMVLADLLEHADAAR